MDRLFQVYALFQNSHIDVEYIKVTGPKISLKIYTKAKYIVFSTDNDRLIQKIIKLHGASKMRVKEALGDSDLSGSDFAKAEKGRKTK